MAATSLTVRNFRPNPTQPSDLWNLFELDISMEE